MTMTMTMPFALAREKALPDIPVDVDSGTPAACQVEDTVLEYEMRQLHNLWNEAGLSARAHRRRWRSPNSSPSRILAPISIPEPDDALRVWTSSGTSTADTTPPLTGTRRLWGFLSARPFAERQDASLKAPNTLDTLRAMAQKRLRRKLRYTKSAPNLGDQGALSKRQAVLEPAALEPVEVLPEVELASSPPGELGTPAPLIQPDDMDEHAIYFTIDPTWRASQGSVRFQFITPVPDSPTSLGRPDSPLLHRHHSLDQLSYAAQEAGATLPGTEPSVACSGAEGLHPIDELHACLEL